MKQRLTSRGKTSGRADDNEETIIKRWGPPLGMSCACVDMLWDVQGLAAAAQDPQ